MVLLLRFFWLPDGLIYVSFHSNSQFDFFFVNESGSPIAASLEERLLPASCVLRKLGLKLHIRLEISKHRHLLTSAVKSANQFPRPPLERTRTTAIPNGIIKASAAGLSGRLLELLYYRELVSDWVRENTGLMRVGVRVLSA